MPGHFLRSGTCVRDSCHSLAARRTIVVEFSRTFALLYAARIMPLPSIRLSIPAGSAAKHVVLPSLFHAQNRVGRVDKF